MSAQAPRRQQNGRGSGGRALMLLGVLLAVLSGVLVIYIVSQATNSGGGEKQVLIAQKDIPRGTVLTYTNIQFYFEMEPYPSSFAPYNAYTFTNWNAAFVLLNNDVVTQTIFAGDVLQNADPRIGAPGSVGQSIVKLNPTVFPITDVLFTLNYSSPGTASLSFITPGDQVDILVLECSAPYTQGGCVDQTTLQDITVYATFPGSVVLGLTTEQAEQLRVLANSGTVDFVIRNPNDGNSTVSPTPMSPTEVAGAFGYP